MKTLIAITKKIVLIVLIVVFGMNIFNPLARGQGTVIAPTDPSLVYSDSEVPVIMPRSAWDNSPELNALLNWMPEYDKTPSDWQPVERIIIHHSATPTNDPYPAISRIQSIYRFHAVTQGWGDIGYNYIIDQQGKIYEGRYGGNGSRGAHTYYDKQHDNFNYGSIGIVLLGTYTNQDINPIMYASLSRLVAWLATANNLDPLQMKRAALVWSPVKGGFVSTYTLPVVLGHKDIEGTSCPGMIDLDKVRQQAGIYKNAYQNYVYQTSDYQADSEKYYAIQSGIRKIYNSLTEYTAVGYRYSKIVPIKLSQLNLFSDHRLSKFADGSLIKVGGESSVYLIEDGKARPLEMAPEQFLQLGYNFNSAKEIPRDDFLLYALGKPIRYGPDNSLVKAPSNPQVFYIEKGKKRVITSAALFDFLGFVWTKIKNLADDEIDSYLTAEPMNYPDGSLIKSDNSSTVYLLKDKKLWSFISANIFESLKYSWNSIKTLPRAEISSFVIGGNLKYPDGSLIKAEDSPLVYAVKNGQAVLVPTAKDFESAGYKWSDIITLSVGEFNALYPNTTIVQPAPAPTPSPAEESEPTTLPVTPPAGEQQPVAGNSPIIRIGITETPVGKSVIVSADGPYKQCDISGNCQGRSGQTTISYSSSAYAKFIPDNDSVILKVDSYEDWNWNKSANYNRFRGNIEVRYSSKSQALWIVNELPLEKYLQGNAESIEADPYEHIKSIIVAARTYAYYHLQKGGKYGIDEIFHLKNTSNDQLYKGYGRESLAPSIVRAVNESRGEIITYNGQPITAAYSSGAPEIYTSGTRNACTVWGGKFCETEHQYLSGGVKDPAGTEYEWQTCTSANHCVGLSAAGSRRLAELGKTYREILMYYYKNTSISTTY